MNYFPLSGHIILVVFLLEEMVTCNYTTVITTLLIIGYFLKILLLFLFQEMSLLTMKALIFSPIK